MSRMAPRGWYPRYRRILARAGYSEAADARSARLLARIAGGRGRLGELEALVRGRPALVVGSGPSLPKDSALLRGRRAAVIAADSAARFIAQAGARPHAVVTDLDGPGLAEAARRAVMVVHAHGDNAGRLGAAAGFPRLVCTCQCRPPPGLHNFGGFTDGDRAAFMADALGASEIILLGMDFGRRIGRHSRTPAGERAAKIRKLREAEGLIGWLGSRRTLYSTAGTAGTVRVSRGQVEEMLSRRGG